MFPCHLVKYYSWIHEPKSWCWTKYLSNPNPQALFNELPPHWSLLVMGCIYTKLGLLCGVSKFRKRTESSCPQPCEVKHNCWALNIHSSRRGLWAVIFRLMAVIVTMLSAASVCVTALPSLTSLMRCPRGWRGNGWKWRSDLAGSLSANVYWMIIPAAVLHGSLQTAAKPVCQRRVSQLLTAVRAPPHYGPRT